MTFWLSYLICGAIVGCFIEYLQPSQDRREQFLHILRGLLWPFVVLCFVYLLLSSDDDDSKPA